MGNSVMLNGVEYAGEQIAYKDSTYELVSKVAYLIGVPLRIFQNEHEPPKIEIYDRLEQDKNARIIRNLCIIRTAIERNYRKINDIMRMEYRGLLSMPEIIPASSMQQLSNDGISFIKKSSTKLCHHIIEINRLISDRINNCKSLFPIWINWTYIKELFIMPNGLTEDGTKDAADIYYASLSYYPYQMYLNWVPMDEGNVLYNDKKFATLLYQWHCDAFTEYSKVSDAGAFVKNKMLIDLTQHATRCSDSSGQAQEYLIARHAAVETETVLVQICLELGAPSVICSLKECFQITDCLVYPMQIICFVFLCVQFHTFQIQVASVTVAFYLRFRHKILVDDFLQSLSLYVIYYLHPGKQWCTVCGFGYGHHNLGLIRTTTSFAVMGRSANIAVIQLYNAGKQVFFVSLTHSGTNSIQ